MYQTHSQFLTLQMTSLSPAVWWRRTGGRTDEAGSLREAAEERAGSGIPIRWWEPVEHDLRFGDQTEKWCFLEKCS